MENVCFWWPKQYPNLVLHGVVVYQQCGCRLNTHLSLPLQGLKKLPDAVC